METNDLLFRFFDPMADCDVTGRNLPHWSQAGTMCFVTWRTWDSMPASVVAQWQRDRAVWLTKNGLEIKHADWKEKLAQLPLTARREYYRLFSLRWESLLDDCYGTCPLRQPESSKIVADSLHYFDGTRYDLTDFVIMPNHVHLLVVFPDNEAMLKRCDSWKHFTATQLNRRLGRNGRFWETESFDHLVRSEEHWLRLRNYIAQNPIQAKLRDGDFRHYSRKL